MSKHTRAFVGENEKRSETDCKRSLLCDGCTSGRKKHTIIRTDDGGAVVAHHAHDERVCVASVRVCVQSKGVLRFVFVEEVEISATFCFSTNASIARRKARFRGRLDVDEEESREF